MYSHALTQVLFWYLFGSLLRNLGNKHQNNPLLSVCHSSTYIILYLFSLMDASFTLHIKYTSLILYKSYNI